MITWTYPRNTCVTWNERVNVVHTVDYVCSVTDGINTASLSGQIVLGFGESFVEFADLTFQNINMWVKDVIGVDEVATIESAVQSMLAGKANPPEIPVFIPFPF